MYISPESVDEVVLGTIRSRRRLTTTTTTTSTSTMTITTTSTSSSTDGLGGGYGAGTDHGAVEEVQAEGLHQVRLSSCNISIYTYIL